MFLALATLGIAGIYWGNSQIEPTKRRVVGAIIPHHELADSLMDDLGKRLEKEEPERLIIIGPNHFGLGSKNIETNEAEKDHACSEPKKILSRHLPKTSFSCMLISERTTDKEIKNLVEELINRLGKNGVLVASVDFSHYLPYGKAEENDLVTEKLIDGWEIKELNKLGNGYLDSPKTINILLDYLVKIGGTEKEKVNHSNSAKILHQPDLGSTTSYFEMIYYSQDLGH